MIIIVDYGRGNLFSLQQALCHGGASCETSRDPVRIRAADALVLPGVGAFGAAMNDMRRLDLVDAIKGAALGGVPLLGICLGMQLLFDHSTEFGRHEGLGLIPGHVQPLPEGPNRVPNVGWRPLLVHRQDLGATHGDMVYFSHSFYASPADAMQVAASIAFNDTHVPAVLIARNIAGFQFHPEKSGEVGLGMLAACLDSLTGAKPNVVRRAPSPDRTHNSAANSR